MSDWTETRLPDSRCPYCDTVLDTAGSATGATPSPGDITVCVCCASPLTFGPDLTLRMLRPAEIRDLEPTVAAALRRHMAAVRGLNRRRGT